MREQEYAAHGLSAATARGVALRRMGDLDRVRGACRELGEARERDMRRAEYLDEVWQDLRFAARQLARRPGFTAVVALTLALGIGATAAIFSVVDAVVLRPLPFAEPERVVRMRTTTQGGWSAASAANFLDWQAQSGQTVEHLAAAVQTGLTLTGRDVPLLLDGARVTAAYFHVFGVRPMLGRGFVVEEDQPGRGGVVVLSARAWRRYFAADSGVLGRELRLNGVPHTVIGVMPPSFDFRADADELWLPMAFSPEERSGRGASYLDVVGRLRAGATIGEARTTMNAVARRLAQQYPEVNRGTGVDVRPFAAALTADYRGRLFTLLGAVGFVLLIACANIANLLLARGAARAKELAIRNAIGAGRGRIIRQLLTESLALALLGGVAGAALATLGVRALVAISPDGVPRLEQASVDARTLLFTLLLTVASSVLFGLAPALRSVRRDLQGALREGGRGDAAAGRDRLRSALVVAEVTLALVLLTGAGLLTRSAVLLGRVEPGFEPAGVLTARVMLPEAGYGDTGQLVDAYRRILDESRRVPGVVSAGLVLMVPLAEDNAGATITAEGQPWNDDTRIQAEFRIASPGYFETLQIPIRRGRDFTDQDDASAPRVAIVNETLARRLWPGGESPIGQRVTGLTASADDRKWMEVVGVVADVRGGELGEAARPEFYLPVPQTPPMIWPLLQRSLVIVARGQVDAAALERPLRAAVARVDATLALADPRSMEDYLAGSLATSRFNTLLLGALSVIGLLLALIGIYGVIAYFVSQRTQEIGLRMALGATSGSILGLVVRRGLRPVALGVVLGVAASLGVTRVLRGLLYGVTPTDPATIGAVVLLVVGAAVAASLIPARRATRVDPARVLHE